MSEKRVSQRLIRYWDRLAKDEPPPPFVKLNQSAISDIWHQCAVLHLEQPVDSEQPNFKLVYLGDKTRQLLPGLQVGQRITSRTMDRQTKALLDRSDNIVFQPQTVINAGSLLSDTGKRLKYRVCMLPFKDNSDAVSHIMVGFSWIEC